MHVAEFCCTIVGIGDEGAFYRHRSMIVTYIIYEFVFLSAADL